MEDGLQRCGWAGSDPLYVSYHDLEWGVPVHDDQKLFEFLILEGAQAGLSWLTILRKRENFRRAFSNFSFEKVAQYNSAKMSQLLSDSGIIRNKLKIESAVSNAAAFREVRREFGTFDAYVWNFAGSKVRREKGWQSHSEIPARTEHSDAMSRDLKSRGFKFVGSTICYAFMQATGMVNDHVRSCFRYGELVELSHREIKGRTSSARG